MADENTTSTPKVDTPNSTAPNVPDQTAQQANPGPVTPEQPIPAPQETTPPQDTSTPPSPVQATPTPSAPTTPPPVNEEMVTLTKAQWEETQRMLQMLYATADKGRIFNYENAQRAGKQPITVKLSLFGDKIITGWRTIKDVAKYHPTSGKQIGEEQEYELILQDRVGEISKVVINGYPNFSEARYGKRIECQVVGKREDLQGNLSFDVQLPTDPYNGRVIQLDGRFVN